MRCAWQPSASRPLWSARKEVMANRTEATTTPRLPHGDGQAPGQRWEECGWWGGVASLQSKVNCTKQLWQSEATLQSLLQKPSLQMHLVQDDKHEKQLLEVPDIR
ncbi:hypothetical protein SRHO_G00220760 [Serrasalmus rhombeus]